eukprot:CAMPEP_0173120178 /NCGR_PEP_ID=MMETSP1102-20130122/52305_1 /TAXON_ID=49646 /ORGANISM="Geminigera sp., Strain Caron Lab Isolate" /LENGTH=48 /DNA_ID= /DNA_START= /DNA_END= /DNA_ORIENTATION=
MPNGNVTQCTAAMQAHYYVHPCAVDDRGVPERELKIRNLAALRPHPST